MKALAAASMLLFTLICSSAWPQGVVFDYPKGWTFEKIPEPADKSAGPMARLTSEKDKVAISVSILPVKGLEGVELREIAEASVANAVANSIEGRAQAIAFGSNLAGAYVRLTLKDPNSADRYLTVAVHRIGKEIALGAMRSSDADGALLTQLLAIMGSVKIEVKSSGKAPRAAAQTWGAIAVEVVKGETDPYYGIGEGDTQADAGVVAQRFCREAGGRRCQVHVTYAQCGAFAVSASGSGGGIGTSKREAEKTALNACASKSCEIVASDCN